MSFAGRIAGARTVDDVAAAAVSAGGALSAGRVALALGRSTAFVRATEGWGLLGADPIGAVCRSAVIEQDGAVVPAGCAFAELDAGPASVPMLVLQIRAHGMREGALLIEAGPAVATAEWPRLLADAVGAALDQLHRAAGSSAALQDPVTGAASRTGAEGLLQQALARPGTIAGVVSCDLEDFHLVDEALGWVAGDELLRLIAGRLAGAAADRGRVARMSADEFAVVYPDLETEEELAARCDELAAALRSPAEIAGQTVYPTAAFGHAVRTSGSRESPTVALELLRAAQAAMHTAKDPGRRHRLGLGALDLLQLDADLHHALERGEVTAHFQPVYELSRRRVAGFEVLARWSHPVHGAVSPDVFILLAENNGLIAAIGDRMLRAARDFLVVTRGRPLTLHVNASTREVSVQGYADRVAAVFEGEPELLQHLTIEVTESSVLLDGERASLELRSLRALGTGVAIDDFGSGYFSLAQLQELPATVLKIDRALVQRGGVVGHDVVDAVVQLARRLGLVVVAEGVETPEQLEMLDALGCGYAQGFLFSPALPIERALALLTDP
jgi:diguanylate cyclase (GGDEF)-like protein